MVSDGAKVGLTDIRAEPLKVLAAGLSRKGTVVVAPADATSGEELLQAYNLITNELGPVDTLIHAAGRVSPGAVEECTPEAWQASLDLNLTSVFLAARVALPAMRERRRGKFVSCSSVNGRDGGSPLSGVAYAVAKGGIITLTRHLARQYAAYNVQVNCVTPGAVDTPMLDRMTEGERSAMVAAIPSGRLATASEIAAAMMYLTGPESDSITGVALDINGGRYFS